MGIVGSRTLYHAVMVVLSLVYVVPLGWMVMSSFKTKREIFDAPFALPSDPDFGNWAKAWERGDLGGYILNSLFTTVTSVTIILIASLAAAYAFSRLRFRGVRSCSRRSCSVCCCPCSHT
ncbi:hypothetical protein [Homoserinibacter gongjuensis]|uniref:hypothetical protein n=1 Tax=Homoserinibacter gongjuensis TaxID=1162968 RepID=UPI0024E0A7B1|nr:hypothetical protein [Homoserinibacter gongjuensis]